MTKWITLCFILLVPFFVFAQTPDPFVAEVSSLLQSIRGLAEQIGKFQNLPVVVPRPLPSPVPFTGASTPSVPFFTPSTNSFFRRSSVNMFERLREDQALRLSNPANQAVSVLPKITSVSPTEGKIGTRVTLTGVNFTKENNVVYTGFGQLVLPSLDGTTISFTISRPPSMPSKLEDQAGAYWRQNNTKVGLPLGFYVKNANGQTAKPGLFFLTF